MNMTPEQQEKFDEQFDLVFGGKGNG